MQSRIETGEPTADALSPSGVGRNDGGRGARCVRGSAGGSVGSAGIGCASGGASGGASGDAGSNAAGVRAGEAGDPSSGTNRAWRATRAWSAARTC